MKIVYSYIPYINPEGALSPNLLAILSLGVLKAKQFYNEIEIYTNKAIANQIKGLKLPFTKVDTELLKNEEGLCASIPKLKVYRAQTEPYIHIDLDVVLFNPVMYNPHLPVSFAHPDLDLSNSNLDQMENLLLSEPIRLAYIKPLSENILPSYYKKNVKFLNIPNMNTVIVQEPLFFKECVDKALKLYNQNQEYFNNDYYKFCTIEQLSIYAELIEQHPFYQDLLASRDCFLHEGEPLIYKEDLPSIIHINTYNKRSITLTSPKDLKFLLKENFGGYAHFTFSKTSILTQTIITHRLIEEFGLEPLKNLINTGYSMSNLQQELLKDLLTQQQFNQILQFKKFI